MKICISGKGGAGKTTLAAALASLLAQKHETVFAVDADPDPNLASALGIPQSAQGDVRHIAQDKSLIEERTGSGPGYGQMFLLNPNVKDLADKYAFCHRGISLIILGAIERGGAGCACAGSTLLRSLVQDLVLQKNEHLILDMEAGIEHLGRATARGVDVMLIVTEPGQRSIESTGRILRLGGEIGLKRFGIVSNKVSSQADRDRIAMAFPEIPIAGEIPFSREMMAGDRDGASVMDGMSDEMKRRFEAILEWVVKGGPSQ
jgi:CO dehydrogenase maturation factor